MPPGFVARGAAGERHFTGDRVIQRAAQGINIGRRRYFTRRENLLRRKVISGADDFARPWIDLGIVQPTGQAQVGYLCDSLGRN